MGLAAIQFIADHRDEFIAGTAITTAVLLLICVALFQRLGRLNRLYTRLTRNTSGGNIEEVLQSHMASVEAVTGRIAALEDRATRLEERQKRCLQRTAVVRYDAFEEVGGEQSFSLVLLDDSDTGVAVSSVYSRSDVRVYAKEIRGNKSSHPMTQEEKKAMAAAMAKANGK